MTPGAMLNLRSPWLSADLSGRVDFLVFQGAKQG
jgi:hypothetical protein